MKTLRILGAGAAVVSGLLLSATVQAAAYAVSTNTITNFSMGLSSGVTFGGFTFTSSLATLNASGTGSGSALDASASCFGSACTGFNNSFTIHGMAPASYAYGDALIGNPSVTTGGGAASSIGEAQVDNGLASGMGSNSLMGFLTVGASGGAVNFSFLSDLDMRAELTAGGQSATANSNMTITISDLSGAAMFSWAPNGAAGGVVGSVGGTELSDPYNLNRAVTQVGSIGVNPYINNVGSFSASTGTLAAGTYQVNVAMSNSANVQSVPVPAGLWLLLSGLAGLAGFARRRSQ